MRTPDAQARLAYLDIGPLFNLLDQNWALFQKALIDKDVWAGRVIELRSIRNRIGHCRRPHREDLGRIEQTLRDLEGGAFQTIAAFNRQFPPSATSDDPVVAAWVRNEHDDARRLVNHAETQYDVGFSLRRSRRPWSDPLSDTEPISGRPGYLWHAHWLLRSGWLDLRSFWEDTYLNNPRDLLVFACVHGPASVDVSFAAVDTSQSVADGIGNIFDAVLLNQKRGELPIEAWERWGERYNDLDPRVQVNTEWTVIDDSTTPVTIFGA